MNAHLSPLGDRLLKRVSCIAYSFGEGREISGNFSLFFIDTLSVFLAPSVPGQFMVYSTEQQGEGVDRMDTKRKSSTLGECLRAAETWINVSHQERAARGTRYPLSASLCEAAGVGGYSFTHPLVMSL
jgi:hypothetical protein